MGKLYAHAYVKNMMVIREEIASLARIGNKIDEAGIDIIFRYLESL